MASNETETWMDDDRVWKALKYRIQAAHESRSRVRQRAHLEQALLYLNALNAAVVTDSVPRNLLAAEDAESISSPSDAEQLSELRRLAVEARDVLALLVPYGKIHTVNGVTYPDGTHSEAIDRGEQVLNQLRAALNPSQVQKETQ